MVAIQFTMLAPFYVFINFGVQISKMHDKLSEYCKTCVLWQHKNLHGSLIWKLSF